MDFDGPNGGQAFLTPKRNDALLPARRRNDRAASDGVDENARVLEIQRGHAETVFNRLAMGKIVTC